MKIIFYPKIKVGMPVAKDIFIIKIPLFVIKMSQEISVTSVLKWKILVAEGEKMLISSKKL